MLTELHCINATRNETEQFQNVAQARSRTGNKTSKIMNIYQDRFKCSQ